MRLLGLASIFAAALLAAAAPSALAAPDCEGGPVETRTLVTGESTLESIIVHPNGKLYFSNSDGLLRLDGPNAEPVLHAPVEEPGGLAVEPDGTIIVGTGNSIPNGQMGDATGPASLLRVDPVTGESEVYATGLSMGNGVDRGPDGAIYASNDFGMNIDRIVDGETERGWAKVDSGNGLQVDSTGKWLYVNQTFRPAAVQRVEIADPDNVKPFAVAPPEDMSAGFDGMDRDSADNLFIAANAAGSIWKVTPEAEMCVLLRGLPPFPDGPSAVSVGVPGSRFPAENLYVVAFNGDLTEIEGVAVPPPPAALDLAVKPKRVKVGRSKRFRFTVTSGGAPVKGAKVQFGGEAATTGASGHARIKESFKRPGKRRARATKKGYDSATTLVRVYQPGQR